MSSTYLRTSTCLPALCKVRIRNACRRSTARPQPGGSPQGIERKAALNGKLLKLRKRHSLVALGAIKKYSSLVLLAGVPSLSLEGQIE
eukprot:1259629-Amphidinium_carterae.1